MVQRHYHAVHLLLAICASPVMGLRRSNESNPWAHLDLHHLDLPICFHTLPSANSSQVVELITQQECETASGFIEDLPEPYRQCMARKRTCALVGSSAHLLNASFGAEIDSHEEVVRINLAPAGNDTNGFTEHVGSKTTARFLNGDATVDGMPAWKDECLFMKLHRGDYRRATRPRTKGKFHHNFGNISNRTIFLDKLYPLIASQLVAWPTTGLIALPHLLHTCDSITIYGYGSPCEGNRLSYAGAKYYETSVWIAPGHSYDKEFDLMTQLAKAPIVKNGLSNFPILSNVTMKLPSCFHEEMTSIPMK